MLIGIDVAKAELVVAARLDFHICPPQVRTEIIIESVSGFQRTWSAAKCSGAVSSARRYGSVDPTPFRSVNNTPRRRIPDTSSGAFEQCPVPHYGYSSSSSIHLRNGARSGLDGARS